MGGAYLKSWDQISNVGILGYVGANDTRVLGGVWGIVPHKSFVV